MNTLTQSLRAILALSAFFAAIYVNDLWVYLAPTHRLRRWGVATFRLSHPAWPGDVGGGRRE